MIGRIAELLLFGLAPLMVGGMLLPAAMAQEDRVTLAGEVAYRERMALPPQAVVTVELLDVSLADAPAARIAEQTIVPNGQVPVGFELSFDRAVIQPQQRYALTASIKVDNQLWFANGERYDVDPLAGGKHVLMLKKIMQ